METVFLQFKEDCGERNIKEEPLFNVTCEYVEEMHDRTTIKSELIDPKYEASNSVNIVDFHNASCSLDEQNGSQLGVSSSLVHTENDDHLEVKQEAFNDHSEIVEYPKLSDKKLSKSMKCQVVINRLTQTDRRFIDNLSLNRHTHKTEGANFMKKRRSDVNSCETDIEEYTDICGPPGRKGKLANENSDVNKISEIEKDLHQLKEGPSFVNDIIYLKEEPSLDATCEEDIHGNEIKIEENVDYIETQEFPPKSSDYGRLDRDLPNPDINPFSPSRHNQIITSNCNMVKSFTCSYCDFKTFMKSYLVKHLRTHIIDKTFPCSYCGYKASTKSILVIHLRIHTGEKPFSCSYCDYKCITKARLTKHLTTHKVKKSFLCCSYCGYKATSKSSLVIHLRTHTGEKPFSCSYCNYKTSRKDTLVTHLKIHHAGDNPFTCSYCDYKDSMKSNLIKHLRIHTGEKPYPCPDCDYIADQKSSLVKHLRTHTRAKSFSCSYCDYESNKPDHLVRHLKIHIGEKS